MNDIKILNGDCFELLKEIASNSIDCVLTDPPYGMDLTPQRDSGKFKGIKIANDARLDWTDGFFSECFRVVKNNTGSFFFCSHHCIAEFLISARKAGFEIKNLITWDKKQFGMGGNWRPQTEFIILATKGRFVCKSNNLSNIVRYSRTHHSKAQHPTQKPVDLLKHLLSEPDYNPQHILDPFMGSGSTGVACVELGLGFTGIELDKGFFRIARRRIWEAEDAL